MIYLHPDALDMLKTMKVTIDPHIVDSHYIKRSWKERLFTKPWEPFKSKKVVYCPIAYILKDGTALISPKTKKLLDKIP